MKTTLLTAVAVATFAMVGVPNTAEAGPRRGGGGHHHHHRHGHHHHGHLGHGHHHHHHRHHHMPVYKVRTVEISRHVHCRTAFDRRGRPYEYHVTVVTYCDHYSDGSSRTWTRTFS